MKLQNLEAIIVVFVLIFVLMVMIPRCRKNPAAEVPVVTAPIPTPQPLPTPGAEPTATTPAVAEANPATTTPAPAPAAVVPAPAVVPAEKVTTPESFARKLTPKPMTTTTQRAVPRATVPATGKEETVAFNPDGGGAVETGGGITFYTVVPDVKIRAQPGLDAKILGKIPKDIAVTYLNVRTDKTQKLTIDNIPHDEPWLKIRTKKGTIGWVYGGTVRGYKK
jgi:Bacterial SH3 domain